ncbi:MAG: hypothetical protein OXF79_22925 [Chloroflexi bacterium]|nr:hypothetical protein [Chloroflexota bacterium]
MNRTTIPTAVLAALLAGSTAFGQARLDYTWISASEVLNPDGTVKPEFRPGDLPETGPTTAGDHMRTLGRAVARWQQKFWKKFGRASALGLEDGALLNSRTYCIGDMQDAFGFPAPWTQPPDEFDDWAARAEAIIEARVSRLAPGFDIYGDPQMLLTLSVDRHLFVPERPYSNELHIVVPVGEFVSGDAVFCRAETWGGYRPRVGDRLIVGAFVPAGGPSHSVLQHVESHQIFRVDEDSGKLRRLGREPQDRGFPTSLHDFASQVHQLWLDGALDEPSAYEVEQRKDRARQLDRVPE